MVLLLLPLIFIVRTPPAGANRFGNKPEAMNFFEAVGSFFRNYANFSGRASRSEYWYSYLLICITSLVDLVEPSGNLSLFLALLTIVPLLAVSARRLHDINRSGWHQLLGILPPIGTIALLIWNCMRASDAGDAVAMLPNSSRTIESVEILERLARLRDNGAISTEEYDAEKRKILG
ncbi:MAG: DUF805 domain-containing protein [Rhizobiaceae bacterium]|nr:DUF805 domain-containing protein [Rhizobiaceae bacterium]